MRLDSLGGDPDDAAMHVGAGLRVLLGLSFVTVGCGPSATELVQRGIEAEVQRYDYDAAADAYEPACRMGYGVACLLFENVSRAFRPTKRDYELGQARYQAACKQGDGKACFRFGLLHDGGMAPGLEPTRALTLFQRACDLGYDYACQRAASLYVVLWGFDISVTQSRALCERSCQAGYGRACVVLADLVKGGKGGPRSRPRSRELLRLACERGQSAACIRLAKRTLHRAKKQKIGSPADAAADVEPLIAPLTEVCHMGHLHACQEAERLLTAALPRPQTQRAMTLYESKSVAMRRVKASHRAIRTERAAQREETRAFYQRYWKHRCYDEDAGMACFKLKGPGAQEATARGTALMQKEVLRWSEDWHRQCDAGIPFGCVKLLSAYKTETLEKPAQKHIDALKRRSLRLIKALRARWAAQSDPSE